MTNLMVQQRPGHCAMAQGRAQDLWEDESTASAFVSERNISSKRYFSNSMVKFLCPQKAEPKRNNGRYHSSFPIKKIFLHIYVNIYNIYIYVFKYI